MEESLDALEEALAEALAAYEEAGFAGAESVLGRFPDQAEQLRARLDQMVGLGLAGDAGPPSIDGFELSERLGRGGMGEVWRATQLRPVKRDVAVKVMLAGAESEAFLRRFESERHALARMKHPGIAQIFSAGSTDRGQPYFAMELVEGETLTGWCDSRSLGIPERLGIFVQVCDAIHHAHQRGVMHRDLKPANVMVTEVDGNPQPKVIDFGLAKAVGERLIEHSLATQVGQPIGTLQYMSPEQADGAEHGLDVRTDVFALGVMLYELLTGMLPLRLERGTPAAQLEFLRRLVAEEPVQPSERAGSASSDAAALLRARRSRADLSGALRGDLDWIVLCALARDPERRYATVRDLSQDVLAYLCDEPVQASPPSTAYRLRKFVRRNRLAVSISGGIAVLVLVALAVSLFFWFAARRSLTQVDLLVSLGKLDGVTRDAREELWPAHPALLPNMRAWLDDSAGLLARRSELVSITETLQGRYGRPLPTVLAAILGNYEQGFQDLAGPDGLRNQVLRRIDWAQTLRERSISAHLAEWEVAIQSIADSKQCPLYRGLRIVPQLGLVPLRRNPQGLWEFRVLTPDGKAPEVGGDGTVRVTEGSDPILVLLPGGATRVGAQNADPEAARYDPNARPIEQPVVELDIAPFFMQKHEVWQGLWIRTMDENPSAHPIGYGAPGYGSGIVITSEDPPDARSPVENMSLAEARLCARKLGLQIPSEVQWEFAARGTAEGPYGFGGELSEAEWGVINLCDARGGAMGFNASHELWDDGRGLPDAVDSRPVNSFGLHNVLGNVAEMCDDAYAAFDAGPAFRGGDGRRDVDGGYPYPVRGGSFVSRAVNCRLTARLSFSQDSAHPAVGVRFCRPLDR